MNSFGHTTVRALVEKCVWENYYLDLLQAKNVTSDNMGGDVSGCVLTK